ncbi:MAG: DUF6634 family protein, partial [Methylocystis sp.]
LEGVVEGHPIFGSRPINTSPLWLLNTEKNWARSLSRFYRLGSAASLVDEGEVVRH